MKRFGSVGAIVTAAACAALVQSASADNRKGGRDFFVRPAGRTDLEVKVLYTPDTGKC